MIIDPNLNSLKDVYCGVCGKGVGSNSILCPGIARPIEERPQTKWLLSHADELDMEFCYLGDVIRAGGDCGSRKATRIRRIRCTWGKFPELLLLIKSRRLSFKTRGRIYDTCDLCSHIQVNAGRQLCQNH